MPRQDGTFTPEELASLREQNVIEATEVAFKQGDLFIAENVITRQRRQLNSLTIVSAMNEGRRVLHG